MATILVLALIGEAAVLRPAIIRVAGTAAGSALLILVVAEAKSLIAVYIVGLLLCVAAVVTKLGSHTWLYYVLMVPTTACLNAFALPQVGQLGAQRVVDNVVGGLLVLAASAMAIAYSRWEATRGNSTTDQQRVAGEPVPSGA